MTLTVVCLYVRGEYPYTPEYVTRLYGMAHRWIGRPFRFVCLTDQPWLFSAPIESMPIKKLPGFAPWTKLELFNPARAWTGRVLYLDLDVLIVAPLEPIIDAPYSFAITDDPEHRQKPKNVDGFGRQIVRRFNSSIMVWNGGQQTELYSEWTPTIADRLSGDQDWIGQHVPLAPTLPREWFPRISELGGSRPVPPAKVVLAKVPKNHIAVSRWPWVAEYWGPKCA